MAKYDTGDDIDSRAHPDGLVDYEAATYSGGHDPGSGSASLHDPDSGVKRGLKNRHLSMMALAGIIGPGLLVGAGGALMNGGPASLIIGFGVIGEFTVHDTSHICVRFHVYVCVLHLGDMCNMRLTVRQVSLPLTSCSRWAK